VRDANALALLLDAVDVVCHQAAMVGSGVTVSDLPLYAGHNDLGTAVVLASMAAHRIDRLVLASSMVVYGEGRYACVMHGLVEPPPRAIADLRAGRFDPVCPSCGRSLAWRLVEESTKLRPRGAYAASKVAQEHYAATWAAQALGHAWRCGTTTSTARRCRRTRRIPGWPRSSGQHSRTVAQGVRGRPADA
jgi:dTDP-L-rhamnose 4-epimerase